MNELTKVYKTGYLDALSVKELEDRLRVLKSRNKELTKALEINETEIEYTENLITRIEG